PPPSAPPPVAGRSAQTSAEGAPPTVAARRITTAKAVAGHPGVADDSAIADDEQQALVADLAAEVPRAATPVPGRETSPLVSPSLPGPTVVARTIDDPTAAPVRPVERPASRLGAPLAAARRILGLPTLQPSFAAP